MSFLAPLFLAGAAAVAFPILFHLIRRSSRERISFSSLMFLTPSPPRITKRSRLEHLLLLALRCGLLCLLAFAFARPFLAKPATQSVAPADQVRALVLLDVSASMRRENLWIQAKEEAVKALSHLDSDDLAGVYVFDQQPRPLLTLDEARKLTRAQRVVEVQSRLDGVQPGWGPTHIGNALLGAVEALLDSFNRDSSDQGTSQGRIVMISDFQSGARLDGLQGFEWPGKFQVDLVALKPKDASNAGLQLLRQNQNFLYSKSNSPVRVRVQNAPGSEIDQFQVQWHSPSSAVGSSLPVYVPAGQSKTVTVPQQNGEADRLVLTGDRVDFDNVAFHISPATRHGTIAYLGEAQENDPHQSLYYVKRAFEQTNLALTVISGRLNLQNAKDIELLIAGEGMDDSKLDRAKEIVEQGRTLIFPVHTASDASALEKILDQGAVKISEAPVSNFAMIGGIDFKNQLLAPFADARFSDFTKIHFWHYRKLDLSRNTNAQVLIKFDSGDPLLTEVRVGKGNVLVLASTWRPQDSQLALSSKFVPILFAALEQSSGEPEAVKQYMVGESVRIERESGSNANSSSTNGSREMLLPDGRKVEFIGDVFTSTTLPGVYRAGSMAFAVNVDPSESKTAPMPIEDLQSLGVPLGKSSAPNTKTQHERQRNLLAAELEGRQKFWRWIILAAIGVVLIETWTSSRLSQPGAPAA